MQDAEVGLTVRHYNNVKDAPEVIALCVNCRMRRCPGICEKYREKIREARRKRGENRGKKVKAHA